MKKFRKGILVLATLISILTMNFLCLINSVYATDLGCNIQLQNEGDCGELLKYDGMGIVTVYVTYTSSDGNVYPAYCLNKYLNGVGKVDAYAVSTNDYVTDMGLWRTIINGYPYKTVEELGCANKYEAFTATKQAVYCYIHENNLDLYEGVGEAGERTLNALKMIVANAQSSTETKLETSINIDKSISNWEQDNLNPNYISKIYSVYANSDFYKYQIALNKTEGMELPEGIMITNLQNEEKSEFAKGENFKVLIPIKSLKVDGEFLLNVKSDIKTKPIIYGTAPDASYQDYALTAFQYENGESTIADKYYKNDTKIVIYKKEKNTQVPLEGVYFNLENDKNEIIHKGLKTDKNGEIIIKDLLPGKYFLIETSTLEGYEKIDAPIEINLKLNEKIELTVNNNREEKIEVEKPKQEIKVKQEVKVEKEEVKEIKKLPKTGM